MNTRRIQVLISFDVIGEATDEQIESLVIDAVAQIDDPRDEDGERVAFDTGHVDSEWEEVQA